MADVPAANDQGIRDQSAVTALRQDFGTHEGRRRLASCGHQLIEGCEKLGGLHVIGVGVELLDAPAGVGRIGQPLTPPATQIDKMAVFNSEFGERFVQRLLRFMTTTGTLKSIQFSSSR